MACATGRIARELVVHNISKPMFFVGIPTNLACPILIGAVYAFPNAQWLPLLALVLNAMMVMPVEIPKDLGTGLLQRPAHADDGQPGATSKASGAVNWDLDTQQPHGGQEWSSIPNFVEDFSVTTNYLGAPASAISACGLGLAEVEHYPPANFEPYLSQLAAFIAPESPEATGRQLLLGNGASELIDLVTRVGAHDGSFAVPRAAQYK